MQGQEAGATQAMADQADSNVRSQMAMGMD